MINHVKFIRVTGAPGHPFCGSARPVPPRLGNSCIRLLKQMSVLEADSFRISSVLSETTLPLTVVASERGEALEQGLDGLGLPLMCDGVSA